MKVFVNEWGVEELTPAQEAFLEDAAEQAGCEHAETCDELTVCEPCGLFVCREHTRDTLECDESGVHHGDCWRDCARCVDAQAREDHGIRRAG